MTGQPQRDAEAHEDAQDRVEHLETSLALVNQQLLERSQQLEAVTAERDDLQDQLDDEQDRARSLADKLRTMTELRESALAALAEVALDALGQAADAVTAIHRRLT